VAPTDSRRREDIRALENGDFAKAALEKTRLEEKQRASRKDKSSKAEDIANPVYFSQEKCEHDGLVYWKYNGTYFEQDRKN